MSNPQEAVLLQEAAFYPPSSSEIHHDGGFAVCSRPIKHSSLSANYQNKL
jgi:hypothetical protein